MQAWDGGRRNALVEREGVEAQPVLGVEGVELVGFSHSWGSVFCMVRYGVWFGVD